MRYYNSLSCLFEQDFNPGNYPKLMKKIKLKMNSTPSPEGCIKINVDVSKIYTIWFITVGVVGKDMCCNTVIQEGSQIRDCSS